jgi:predicted transcriptional regulator
MPTAIKQALHELADQLPDDCDWDEVMYRLYVRQKIEAGLNDVAAGRLLTEEEVFEEFRDDGDPLDAVGSR